MAVPQADGQVTAAISNALVQLFRRHYGRGPTKAKTYVFDNYVFAVLEGILTTVEETLVGSGREELVREMRLAFQAEMAGEFHQAVENVMQQRVITYHSQVVFDPPMAFEIFVLEPAAEAGG